MSTEDMLENLEDLMIDYHELNSENVEELTEEPSALEFMRYVAQNRPFVVRKAAKDWRARRNWTADHFIDRVGNMPIKVAVTPNGNADAVVEESDGDLLFVKPYEGDELFKDVVEYIQDQESSTCWSSTFVSCRRSTFRVVGSGDILACREHPKVTSIENDNLRHEYARLFEDVPDSLDFARIALQKDPDAINFWLGNSYSTTAMHKDNYENIFVQVLGSKNFTILPPVEALCMNEQYLACATYRVMSSRPDVGFAENMLVPEIDSPSQRIPFPIWDPEFPSRRPSVFSKHARPMNIMLNEGDMLYLPALWYHKVSQICNSEGLCVSVNYWYDMDFSGSLPSLATFVQNLGCQLNEGESRN